MLVWIEEALFCSPLALSLRFFEVFALASDGRHRLLTRPLFKHGDDGSIGAWLEGLPMPTKVQARRILDEGIAVAPSASAEAPSITITLSSGASIEDARFDLDHAILLLRMPLGLLLEDRSSDLGFLLKLCPPTQRQHLRKAIEDGWVEVVHGGGLQSMRTVIDSLTGHGASTIERLRLLRLWVIFDGDADPRDRGRPSPQSEKLKQLCTGVQRAASLPWPLGHHRLGRRSIENYLPERALRVWQESARGRDKTERRQRVDALCELRKAKPDAARQIDMKKGLLGDVLKPVRDEIGKQRRDLRDDDLDPLFRGLSDKTRKALKDGFGRDIAVLFSQDATHLEEHFRRELDRDPPGSAAIVASLLARL